MIESTLKIEPEKRMDVDSEPLKDAMKKLRAAAKKLSATARSGRAV